MITRKIHMFSKIHIKEPYVFRVQYQDETTAEEAKSKHRQLHRNMYKNIQSTWGYSTVRDEDIPSNETERLITSHHLSYQTSNVKHVRRGYFFFTDELDGMQFMLSSNAIKLSMWPDNLVFTIHEVINTES